MAISFPTSPAVNDTYTFSGKTWTYNGTGWALSSNVAWKAPIVQTVSYSSTPSINWAGIDVSKITLTGNATITNTGAVDGQKMLLEVTQDGAGSRTISFTSETRFGTDITAITLSTTASKTDRIGLVYNSAASKYDVIAFVKGY